MWIGEGVVSVTGDNVTAGVIVYKIFSLACFAGLVWAVTRLAAALKVNASLAVWLGVANPLSVIHLVGGMHNEVTMMLLVCTGLLAAVRLPAVRGALLGAVLVGAGIALKATAAIALPFLVWIFVARYAGPLGKDAPVRRPVKEVVADVRHGTLRRAVTLITGGVACLAVSVGMLTLVTVASGQSWGWVSEISGNSKVINPLAVPSLVASVLVRPIGAVNENIFFNDIIDVVRPVSTVVMVLILVIAWAVWRRSVKEAFIGATVAYVATCLFNAVVLPWYYMAPLALVGLWIRDRRAVFAVAWLAMVLSMTFDGSGNNRLYNIPWLILVGMVMWWLARTCLRQDDSAEESADGHPLGAAHDLAGEVPVEGVDGSPRQ
jgi:alpha-1,6-mannosyltransferase